MTVPTAREIVLPNVHDAADAASGIGQRRYVSLNALRLISVAVAAIAGTWTFTIQRVDASGSILLTGFVIAAVAEFALIQMQPERDWYAGRAVAESAKTLSWRYAV